MVKKIEDLTKNIIQAMDEYGTKMPDVMKALTNTRETHIEIDCPSCGENTLFRHYHFMSGPYGGFVACHSCDYRRGTYSFLGEQMIQVQPMPKGALEIYDKGDKE